MRPVLFQRWGITIRSYLTMMYVGLVAGVVAGNAAAHAAGLDAYRVFVATFALLVPAMIGARLLYVASHWGIYRRNPRRIWNRSEGGATLDGGLVLAFPLSAPVAAALHLSWGALCDVAVFSILVALVFSRVGCLLHGCCAGRPSASWLAVSLPNLEGVWARRLPTQCLEATWAAILLVFAVVMRQQVPFPGALCWTMAAAYASGRLVLQSTRENGPGAARFTVHHVVSVVLILLSIAALVARWPQS